MADNTQNEKHCVKCTQFWTGGSMSSHCIDGENHEWSDTLVTENERLNKQLDIAMKALEHYSNPSNWIESPLSKAFYYDTGDESEGFAVALQAIEDAESVK